jgi:hypothetical protein
MQLNKQQQAIVNNNSYTLQDLAANMIKAGFTSIKTPQSILASEVKPTDSNAGIYDISSLNALDNANKNMDVSKQLSIAYKNKDITNEMMQQLSNDFTNKPQELSRVLRALADERLRYLMSLSWSELDKSGESEELYNKYLAGYKFKKNQAFGGANKIAQDAIFDGFFTQGDVNGWKWNFGDDVDKLIQVMYNAIQNKINLLMDKSWDKLSTDNELDFLKLNYLQGFKQKYLSKFGIEYTDKK